MMTKPKIIARDFTAAEPPVPPTEIWCEPDVGDGGVVVCARNEGVHGGRWSLLWIDGDGVHFSKNIPRGLGLALDDVGRLKVAE